MASLSGRRVVVLLTNKSGGAVVAGDVVIMDSSNNEAFTTTTTLSTTITVGIAQETIANNAIGRVLISGYAALINVNASVTRLNYGATYSVAKQATDVGARAPGTFVQFLKSGTTPSGIVFPTDLGGTALTNPMSAIGDLIQGTTAGAPARLAAVAAGKVLVSAGVTTPVAWGYPPFHGARVYNSGNVALSTASETIITFNSERYDTDGYHNTGADTERLTIPTGLGGYYRVGFTVRVTATPGAPTYVVIYVGGSTIIAAETIVNDGSLPATTISTEYFMNAGDYFQVKVYAQTASKNATANLNYSPEFWCSLIGV